MYSGSDIGWFAAGGEILRSTSDRPSIAVQALRFRWRGPSLLLAQLALQPDVSVKRALSSYAEFTLFRREINSGQYEKSAT